MDRFEAWFDGQDAFAPAAASRPRITLPSPGRGLLREMVKRGAATPYFPNGTRGAFDERLLNAARKAKAAGRGLWGECPGTSLNVDEPVDTDR